ATVDRQARDARGDEAAHEGLGLARRVEQADLDADADPRGGGDVAHEGLEDGDEAVRVAQQSRAHAARDAEGFGAACVDVDARDVRGDEAGGGNGAGGVRGAELEDKLALLADRVETVDDGLARAAVTAGGGSEGGGGAV